jgi:hypothetical protein
MISKRAEEKFSAFFVLTERRQGETREDAHF